MSRLKKKFLIGSSWVILATIGVKLLRLLTNIILARFLAPSAFGLIALGDAMLKGVRICSELGINQAIVQNNRKDIDFINTAWTLQVLRGFFIFFIGVILSYPLSHFYQQNALLNIIPFIGISALISNFNSPSLAILKRKLKIKLLMGIELWGTIFTRLSMIITVFISPNYWALLIGTAVGSLFRLYASFRWTPPIAHRFQLEKTALKELLKFGLWITLGSSIIFFGGNLDKLLLGFFPSPKDAMAILGLYSISYTFASIPLEFISNISKHTIFPTISHIRRTKKKNLEKNLLKIRYVLLLSGFFVTYAVILISPWFFDVFYTSDYASTKWMTPLLSVSIWITILNSSVNQTLLGLGRTRELAISGGIKVILMAPFYFLGYQFFGVPGFILGGSLAELSEHLFDLVVLKKEKISLFRQDLLFSMLFIAFVCIGIIPSFYLPALPALAYKLALTSCIGIYTILKILPFLIDKKD